MHCRPSHREITRRLNEAKEALRLKKGYFPYVIKNGKMKVSGEMEALGDISSDEILDLILNLLEEEIVPDDYAGKNPPEKAYEKMIKGEDLWAFCWYSKLLKKRMYLKFVIKNKSFYYVSLHESK